MSADIYIQSIQTYLLNQKSASGTFLVNAVFTFLRDITLVADPLPAFGGIAKMEVGFQIGSFKRGSMFLRPNHLADLPVFDGGKTA